MDIEITNINKGTPKLGLEWVMISVNKSCNLSDYILFDTTYTKDKKVSNENRHSFRFPSIDVKEGDVVFVNTGEGVNKPKRYETYTAYDLYWGLDEHVWNNDGDCALLVKVEDSQLYDVP